MDTRTRSGSETIPTGRRRDAADRGTASAAPTRGLRAGVRASRSPRRSPRSPWAALFALAFVVPSVAGELRGTGDLGVVVERAAGRVQIVDTTARASLATVGGLGDLSHASIV